MRTTTTFILAASLLLCACKKNSDDNTHLKEDRIALLVNKKWQMTEDFYWQRTDYYAMAGHRPEASQCH